MKHIVSIIGARPQLIKASAISRVIRGQYSEVFKETLIHTGQHYDPMMNADLLRELDVSPPDYQFEIQEKNQGAQSAEMMKKLEDLLLELKPDVVLLYGDTNSTLAGALVASKMNIPIAHVEAGMRSYNKTMPEEINRVVCDHCSTWLFSPTKSGIDNLLLEGFSNEKRELPSSDQALLVHSGDVMYDNVIRLSEGSKKVFERLELLNTGDDFVLLTLHRPFNVDSEERLLALLKAINKVLASLGVVAIFPVHPRAKKLIASFDLKLNLPSIIAVEPMSYMEMLGAEQRSKMIITDSGGVQKEAYFFRKNCAIIRPETEWIELLRNGSAELMPNPKDIEEKLSSLFLKEVEEFEKVFGDGRSAEYICETLKVSLKC